MAVVWNPYKSLSANWRSICCDSTGTKLAACVGSGSIYTGSLTDSTWTWTQHTAGVVSGNHNWFSICSNSDGTKLAACVSGGSIYTGSFNGTTWTWTQQTSDVVSGNKNWRSICCDSTGTKLAACANFSNIFTSYGTFDTWTEQTNVGSTQLWQSICSNSDGSKLAACVEGGYIYTANSSLLCFNKGTQILSVDNQYIPIENLKKGDLVKIYKSDGSHVYKKVDLIGYNTMINDPLKNNRCMYRMIKTKKNKLIDDLLITGYHSVLIDNFRHLKNEPSHKIEDKCLRYAFMCSDFVPENNTNTYTYYHLTLESEDEDERFGIYANGLLVETTCKKYFEKATLLKIETD